MFKEAFDDLVASIPDSVSGKTGLPGFRDRMKITTGMVWQVWPGFFKRERSYEVHELPAGGCRSLVCTYPRGRADGERYRPQNDHGGS